MAKQVDLKKLVPREALMEQPLSFPDLPHLQAGPLELRMTLRQQAPPRSQFLLEPSVLKGYLGSQDSGSVGRAWRLRVLYDSLLLVVATAVDDRLAMGRGYWTRGFTKVPNRKHLRPIAK